MPRAPHPASNAGFRLAAAALSILLLDLPLVVLADDEDIVTSLQGDDDNNVLTVTQPLAPDADVTSVTGGTFQATATGVDAADGNDTVTGNATIDPTADADVFLIQAPSETESSAESVGIKAGAGNDTVTSNDTIDASSGSLGGYANALSVDDDDTDNTPSDEEEIDVSVTGTSSATGIEGNEGDDSITNNAFITTTAESTIGGGASPLGAELTKELKVDASSTAESTAQGINGGAGDDEVTNNETITSTADAKARTLSIGIASGDGMNETEIAVEANAEATANADGINTESDSAETDNDVSFPLDEGGLSVSFERTIVTPEGNDTVIHDGTIDANASAIAGAAGGSISIGVDGTGGSTANATATADGTGISTGGGADTVSAADTINSSATAVARGRSVSVSESGGAKSKADAKTVAEASAQGILTDSEDTASTFTTTLLINDSGQTTSVDYEATSDAGADTVTSTADITVTADANTLEEGLAITVDGSASSEVDAEASADAIGIGTGGGVDTVTSDGIVDANATADALAVSVAFGQDDGEKLKTEVEAKAGATAVANAGGIVTDGGNARTVLDFDLTISTSSLDSSFHGLLEAFFANDNIFSNGPVSADATARTAAGQATIAIDGAASAKLAATSAATATGLDSGGGSDAISTSNSVSATASALSGALTIDFGQKTAEKAKPKVEAEAGSTANSSAIGIAADSGKTETVMASLVIDETGLQTDVSVVETAVDGDDTVAVGGNVTADAGSNAAALGGSVAIDGAANADIAAKATSNASGIEMGGGNDTFVSGCDVAVPGDCGAGVAAEGKITASAVARAAAVAAGVGVKKTDASSSSTKVKAETVADATATGISTDGGETSQSTAGKLSIRSEGLEFGFEQVSTAASGDDSVENRYGVDAEATAITGDIAVAVTIKGTARSTVENTATATATAVDTGGAADTIINDGVLTSTSDATAASANVSVSTTGAAAANSGVLGAGTTATSTATGISSAGGNYEKSLLIDTFIGFDEINVTADVASSNDSIGADGADSITNRGAITADSEATAAEVTVGVSSKGVAATISGASTQASASAIESGNDGDVINNEGALESFADAETYTANVAVAAKGLAAAVNSVWDGGTKADAEATGIDADSGSSRQKTVDVDVTADSAQIIYEDTTIAASGDDQITNSGKIDTIATANVLNGNVAVTPTGVSAAASTAKATAVSTAIRGGDGADSITNSGSRNAGLGLDSTAIATAVTANVALTNAGVAAAADAVWDGGTTAEATATGIAGDGGNRSETTRLAIGTEEFGFNSTEELAAGSDTISNTGSIDTAATARTISLSVAGAASGVAVATATSTSEARSTAIDAGAGDDVDDVFNSGRLDSTATAKAAAGSISITNAGAALSADSVWDGGTKANAAARGIDLGGGGETLVNEGSIDAAADATAASSAVSVAIAGVAGATATSTGTAEAVAIDASAGEDTDSIQNSGVLTVGADAVAASASVGFTNTGASFVAGAVWDGGTTASSDARGIDVGEGADDIANTGDITVITDAKAAELGISIAVTGVAGAVATSTGEAEATAIDAGDGAFDDIVTNSGYLIADATALAATATVAVTTAGLAVAGDSVWDGGTTGQTQARGIKTGLGADSINNSGEIDAFADSKSASAAVSVAISGVAGATARSTSLSDATAIDAGSGADDDSVINTGDLEARADSLATAAAVTVTTAGAAISAGAVWDGGTTADGRARGIDVGAGADTVRNEGAIDATADVESASATASVAVAGLAGAVGTSSAFADASGIDASAGNDRDDIYSSGLITTNADAKANSATVTVTPGGVAISSDAIWDGGTTAATRARGVETGLGADAVENEGGIEATAKSEAASASVAVAIGGVAGAFATSTAEADSVGLDMGDADDDDTVTSRGDVAAYSDALALSAAVSFSLAGVTFSGDAFWDGGTSALSQSTGMELGAGADEVFSDGNVVADALARANGISVAFTLEGVAGAIAASNSQADAIGISLGAGDDQIQTQGKITTSSLAKANTVSAAAVKFGVSAAGTPTWDGGTRGEAFSSGIDAGQGVDIIANSADIEATATVNAVAIAGSLTVGGVSVANATSSGLAQANAIDGGADDDRIENLGDLSATADANANAVSIAVTGIGVGSAGNSVWNGGTTTDAVVQGIDGGDGDDVIMSGVMPGGDTNGDETTSDPEEDPSIVTATANSRAVSVGVSVTVGGVAVATSTSTANANAAGIDAGAGNDVVVNDSMVTGRADAESDSVNVALTGVGAAVAADSIWNGGTKANANAAGIAGGTGEDQLTNTRSVIADAHSDATSVAVAASIGGVAGAVAVSTSVADSKGMSGDDGDDQIVNDGTLNSSALAEAAGVSVAFTNIGNTVAGTFLDNGTTAQATAAGLAGGEGFDSIRNSAGATINLSSDAETTQTAVAVTLIGVAAAGAQAEAVADGIALDGGNADDVLLNEGVITQQSSANARARSFAVAPGFGLTISRAGAVGQASGAAMAGGDGNDQVSNAGEVTLTSTAESVGQAISFTMGGVALGNASADAIADAFGVRGDDGVDQLSNSGTLKIDGVALTETRSISAALLGVSIAKANSTSTAGVSGMAGGDDDDVISNGETGVVDVQARADVTANSVSVAVQGAAGGEARTVTDATATGIAGDAGDDQITNAGLVSATGVSRSVSSGTAVNATGLASAKAGTEVSTSATGISGGAGADVIVNTGTIRVGPGENDDPWMSSLATTASSFGLTGDVNAESAAFAATDAIGIDGGDADDDLTNSGDIAVVATALSTSSSSSTSIFGSADAGGESGAITLATGLAGGAGNNVLRSLGKLSVEAESRLVQGGGSSFTFAGSGDVGGALEANTRAVGLRGGDQVDVIRTDGEITVTGISTLDSTGGESKTLFGNSDLAVSTGARTGALGIDGGAGDDDIENLASLVLTADSNLTMSGSSYALGGTGETGGTLAATTTVDGILGGDGLDRVINSGDIDITSTATLASFGESDATFGTSSGSSTSGGIVRASGLRGGAADDYVENRAGASIDIQATANVTTESIAYTFGGGSATDTLLTGDAAAVGIAGDDGKDTLLNAGDITLLVAANLKSDGGSKTSIGGSNSVGQSEASGRAVGIDGGDDDDIIDNTGAVDVTVNVVADAVGDAKSGVFVGDAETGAVTVATAAATGLRTGDGVNELTNTGLVLVEADATGYALGYASGRTVSVGNDSISVGRSTAVANAIGIEDGDGASVIVNESTLEVKASARTAKALEAVLTVYRLQGENSEDDNPDSDPAEDPDRPKTVETLPDFEDPDPVVAEQNRDEYPVGSVVYCNSEACIPLPEINSDGNYHQVIETSADEFSWDFSGTGEPPAEPPTNLPDLGDSLNQAMYPDGSILYCTDTECVSDADPDDMTVPDGVPYVVAVEAVVTPGWQVFAALDSLPSLADPAEQILYPEGSIVACTATDCTKDPAIVGEDAEASATYYVVQVTVDDSVDPPETTYEWVPRDGLIIEVAVTTQEDSFPSYAAANGNGLGGTGVASGRSRATASAWGMSLGEGDDNVENRGSISVLADAEAAFSVAADGDNVGDATGTARSFATATAVGFELGNGNNSLMNDGALSVLAQASTQSLSEVTGGDICIWFFGWWCGGGGDGIGTSETTLDLVATGISSGDGIDTITNEDTITVTTAPIVRDDARKGEFVADVRRENSETINVYFSAVATGITTGAGDDEVINNGSLLVEARDLLSGCSNQACIDRVNGKGIDTSTVQAFGILTGTGNDILRNNGLVSATRLVNGVTESQVAIDLGDGDDMLYLGADSEVVGSVSLGEGNDTLMLAGAPMVRDAAGELVEVNLGSESEALMLMGAGEFMSNVTGVSQASKQAAGTYRLARLQPLDSLAIDEGVIELADPESGYSFAPGSQYSTYVNFDLRDQPDLRSGQLRVAGDVDLDGAIDVERRGEDFIANGSRFLVVGAGGDLTGSFVDVTLPEPKPLLAFVLETDAEQGAVNVVVDSPSFATVTSNPVYDQIGDGFDRLAPEATGDLEDVLGTLQQMESGFDEAFAANSPEAHTTPTTTAHSNGQQVTQFLMNHLGTSRASYRQPQTRGAAPSLSWSYDNNGIGFVGFSSNGQLNDGQGQILLAANDGTYVAPGKPRRRDARFQTWGMAATGTGDYDELDGYTGFDMDTNTYALGADFRVADRFLVGAMLGLADTEVDTREIVSSLDMESRYGGVYASWFTDRAYLEAGITYASQSFDNAREVKFMSIDRVAESQHDGTGWLGFFGGGYEFRFNQLILEPYASLFYFELKEDAFAETGADSLNQQVDERETTALFGEFGSNLMIRQNLRSGALEWRARLGVNYDFEIDSTSITYGYQGAPGTSFSVDDRSLSQESLRFGAGLSYVTERTTLALDYAGLANSDYAINSVALRLNLRF